MEESKRPLEASGGENDGKKAIEESKVKAAEAVLTLFNKFGSP